MKDRKRINPSQKDRLLDKNAGVCCVCKERGVGVNLHHIDGDPSNNTDENIAVLCVREHDAHHRPSEYPVLKHLDLSPAEILARKISWESFVHEARSEHPGIVAFITTYGTESSIVGMSLIFQWVNTKIEFKRTYQLLDAPVNIWIDRAIAEVRWLGKNIKVVTTHEPNAIEYCPNCNSSYVTTLDENMALRLTAKDWSKKSSSTIYINPTQASLAGNVFYGDNAIYSYSIHKCGRNLHFIDEKSQRRIPILTRPSIRSQVTKLLNEILRPWSIRHLLIGSGDPDHPDLIEKFALPQIWESLYADICERKPTNRRIIRKERCK